ncbi:MAG TPA: hypothetical protein VD995_00755 [Azospirillum sp.]|nr:hypothetical protein [Azospirillum sp.]
MDNTLTVPGVYQHLSWIRAGPFDVYPAKGLFYELRLAVLRDGMAVTFFTSFITGPPSSPE